MSNLNNPQKQQVIVDNTNVGAIYQLETLSQESNTVNSNNTFTTLILSGNELVSNFG